jgi:HAD superfamily hydrolase (TIGR01484 family)
VKNAEPNLPDFERCPRAVAVDLDGTLLDSDSRLSERTRAAVEACMGQGIAVAIATSRPLRTMRRRVGAHMADGCSLVLMNGALGVGRPPLSGSIRERISADTAGDIVSLLADLDPSVRITVELEGLEFGANWSADPETLWRMNAATPDMVLSVEEALALGPGKIAASRMGEDVSDLAAAVSEAYGDAVRVFPGDGMTFLNIVSASASKSGTLGRLLEPHGMSLAEVVAFGDDVPDLDLLAACGFAPPAGRD